MEGYQFTVEYSGKLVRHAAPSDFVPKGLQDSARGFNPWVPNRKNDPPQRRGRGLSPTWWLENKGAYHRLQSTVPQTLAHALAGSSVGQLAWNYQIYGDNVSSDYILTNVMICCLTDTAASALRLSRTSRSSRRGARSQNPGVRRRRYSGRKNEFTAYSR
jgi:hypothetical protein